MDMPNITQAQWAAAAAWLVANAVAILGLDLSKGQEGAVIGATTSLLVLGWQLADAVIRNGRSRALSAPINVLDPSSTPPAGEP